ncbi:O-acetyl-ADP-ribose deacetylase macrod2 [Actinomortierella ambigua]|nr:O-acetyl-ADP-ribose deacetylase macrod2 [Actinomortierella ambigua]
MYPRSSPADVDVDDIPSLAGVYAGMKRQAPLEPSTSRNQSSRADASAELDRYIPSILWNERISIWKGNIVKLKVDAIVNAANEGLRSGGGGSAIGADEGELIYMLTQDTLYLYLSKCSQNARITSACNMRPEIKHVIHTVGPIGENREILKNAYQSVLELAYENNLKTLAFPCISTGIYGYNINKATPVALKAVRDWLDENPEKGKSFKRIVFCIFDDVDLQVYYRHIRDYFPRVPDTENTAQQTEDTDGAAAHEETSLTESKPSALKKVKSEEGHVLEQEKKKENAEAKTEEKAVEKTEKEVKAPVEKQPTKESEDSKDSKTETSSTVGKDSFSSPSSSTKSDSEPNKPMKAPTEAKDTKTDTNQGEDDDDFVHV